MMYAITVSRKDDHPILEHYVSHFCALIRVNHTSIINTMWIKYDGLLSP